MAELRRRGRPKGARNKRDRAIVEYLAATYGDMREVLCAIAATPVAELVAKLGCSPLEALQEKRLAAIGALPYVAQRQPLAVNLENRQVVYLTINEGADPAPLDDGIGLTARVVKVIEGEAQVIENKGTEKP